MLVKISGFSEIDKAKPESSGKIQEIADVKTIFNSPGHPYTQGLLASLPKPGQKVRRLSTIEGMVPSLFNLPAGCSFCTRCRQKLANCELQMPEMVEVSPGHFVRCHLAKPMKKA